MLNCLYPKEFTALWPTIEHKASHFKDASLSVNFQKCRLAEETEVKAPSKTPETPLGRPPAAAAESLPF